MNDSPQRPFSVSPDEYPFKSHWFERNGSFMHYVDEGQGPPVVMLHGNPTWSFLYRNIIKELEGSCRLIAPDLPGFGFSDHPPNYGYTPQEQTEWVNALIDHLSLDHFILIMQDWGGPIGMSIAVDHPDKVAGLVICNTWCWSPASLLMRNFSAFCGGPLGKYLILQRNFFARRLAPFNRKLMTTELLMAYTDPFPTPASRMGTYIFPGAIRHAGDWLTSIESKINLLADKPVELVFGMKDPAMGNEKTIDRWQGYFPDAPVDRILTAGHYVQEESSERVAASVSRILERVAGQ